MTDSAHGALVWCPFPDETSARAAIETLLDERLVACANMLPGMRSLYHWHGERGEAEEIGVLLKTAAPLLDRLTERLGVLHPYEAPAIMGWRCDAAGAETAAWFGSLRP